MSLLCCFKPKRGTLIPQSNPTGDPDKGYNLPLEGPGPLRLGTATTVDADGVAVTPDREGAAYLAPTGSGEEGDPALAAYRRAKRSLRYGVGSKRADPAMFVATQALKHTLIKPIPYPKDQALLPWTRHSAGVPLAARITSSEDPATTVVLGIFKLEGTLRFDDKLTFSTAQADQPRVEELYRKCSLTLFLKKNKPQLTLTESLGGCYHFKPAKKFTVARVGLPDSLLLVFDRPQYETPEGKKGKGSLAKKTVVYLGESRFFGLRPQEREVEAGPTLYAAPSKGGRYARVEEEEQGGFYANVRTLTSES